MTLNAFIKRLALVAAVVSVFSCGSESSVKTQLVLSGQVDMAGISPEGPVFIAVLSRNPIEAEGSFTDSLVYIEAIDKTSGDFRIDVSDKGLKPGDPVFIAAFADNDYTGGIPSPDAGDILGFYLNIESLDPAYILKEGDNSGIVIRVSREIFSFEASVQGQVSGDGQGTLTVIAYAGEINTLDIQDLDPEAILGYTRVSKTTATVPYHLDILPYGRNVPIENVYVIAFLDKNSNSLPDAGDVLGFYSREDSLPGLLTITEGAVSDVDIALSMTIPEPSSYSVGMEGNIAVADGLDVLNRNIFILVVRASDTLDLKAMIQGDLTEVAYFYKMPANTTHFSFDLSDTGLAPGDPVMVIALCDRQYEAGFPDMGPGDYVGYYQNRADMSVEYVLAQGANRVESAGDHDFSLNKIMVQHAASIQFELDDANLRNNLDVALDPYEHVTVVAVHKYGVDIGGDPVIDMDYIIGLGSITVPAAGNEGYIYSMDLLPAMDHRIPVDSPFEIDGVYVFAVFDGNLNNGASRNNYVGFYWRTFFFTMYPREIAHLLDGVTVLDQTVRFTTDKL